MSKKKNKICSRWSKKNTHQMEQILLQMEQNLLHLVSIFF